jgi:nucleoid DNA-binding protein
MNQSEFYIHLSKRLGITVERAKELADEYMNTLYFFVKKEKRAVRTNFGTFTTVKTRNGFRSITLDERPTAYGGVPNAETTKH